MTKEEAIKHLHTYSDTRGSGITSQKQHEEAKKMAIKALEQSTNECAVSKEQVIEAIKTVKINFRIESTIDLSKYQKEIQEIINHILRAQFKAVNELFEGRQDEM